MRVRRSFFNYTTSLATTFTTLLVSFIATPYILRWLGPERYGVYRLILDWLGYLALVDIGLSDSLIPLFAQSMHTGNETRVRSVLITGIRAFLKLTPIKAVFGIILIWLIPTLVASKVQQEVAIRAACTLGVISTLLSFLHPFRPLVESRQMGYKINQLLAFQMILATGLSLFFVGKGLGTFGQFVAISLSEIPYYMALIYSVSTSIPDFWKHLFRSFKRSSGEGWAWSKIWTLNRANFVGNMCGRIGLSSDSILIGLLLNTKSVTSFFMTQRLATIFQSQLLHIGTATWAGLSELYIQGKKEIFEERLIELSQIIVVMGFVLLGPVIAYNIHFVSLWVGLDHYAGGWVAMLSALNGILLGLLALWSWMFSSLGLVKHLLPYTIVATVVNFATSILFTYLLGPAGPLLGTFTASVAVSFWAVPKLLQKHFSVRARRLYLAVFMPFAKLLPVIALLCLFARSHVPWGWVGLIGEMALSGILLSILSWYLVLTPHEKTLWKSRFQKNLLDFKESLKNQSEVGT